MISKFVLEYFVCVCVCVCVYVCVCERERERLMSYAWSGERM
jgi:hypothetical protein